MKLFLTFVALIGIGALVYFFILFQGPRMQAQEHIRAYQRIMPLPPEGMVPVDPDPYRLPGASEAATIKSSVPDNQESRDRGRVYYRYYCLFCHGENGQGDGPVGYSYMPAPTDLHDPKVINMPDGALLRSMLLGPGHEPVLSYVVHPGHRWYLVAYVRSLGTTSIAPAENYGGQVILRGPETR